MTATARRRRRTRALWCPGGPRRVRRRVDLLRRGRAGGWEIRWSRWRSRSRRPSWRAGACEMAYSIAKTVLTNQPESGANLQGLGFCVKTLSTRAGFRTRFFLHLYGYRMAADPPKTHPAPFTTPTPRARTAPGTPAARRRSGWPRWALPRALRNACAGEVPKHGLFMEWLLTQLRIGRGRSRRPRPERERHQERNHSAHRDTQPGRPGIQLYQVDEMYIGVPEGQMVLGLIGPLYCPLCKALGQLDLLGLTD
jgi:hypothetical protein